jgi:hypothetical protein
VLRIAAELEDVPLRDPDLFKELPGRLGRMLKLYTAQSSREIRHGCFKLYVRALACQ